MTLPLKPCPCCGGAASFSSGSRVYGHGDCPTVHYVQCKGCGMQTNEYPEGYCGSPDACKVQAAQCWNARV